MDKTLSIKERLILANQYEILTRLSRDKSEQKHFDNMREIFVSGFSRYYSMATEWFHDEVNQDECKFVVDVLDLYRDLYFSWKNDIKAQEAIEERKVLFKGFDLNDSIESKYYSFCEFLIEQLGRYSEINDLIKSGKIEELNSHGFGPSMAKLDKMIIKRSEIRETKNSLAYEYLSVEEIKEILNA